MTAIYTFTNNTTIDPAQVNFNFSSIISFFNKASIMGSLTPTNSGMSISNANDMLIGGSIGTTYSANPSGTVTYDFGQTLSFTNIYFTMATTCSGTSSPHIKIGFSTDNVTYTWMCDVTSTVANTLYSYTTPGSFRYIQIYLTNGSSGGITFNTLIHGFGIF